MLVSQYLNRTPLEDWMDCELKFDHGVDTVQSSIRFGPEYIKTKVCKNCTESVSLQVSQPNYCKATMQCNVILFFIIWEPCPTLSDR